MGERVCRIDADYHVGHASPTPNPFHRTPYKTTPQEKVFVEGKLAVVVGGSTACGDNASAGSSKVFIGGIPIHRVGDATSGHGSWVGNSGATGSEKVTAGG